MKYISVYRQPGCLMGNDTTVEQLLLNDKK